MTVNERLQDDWDPKSDAVQRDQRAAYDGMRERCPVAYSDFLGWSLFRHQDIVRVLNDPDTFSNAVSRHLSVPDGMDPPEHTEFRRMILPYFRPERVDAFEPQCREIAANLLQSLLERDELEFIGDFAHWFAVRIQCASLGWPLEMCEPLRLWTQKNHQATFARDRQAMTEIAREFEGYVHQLLQSRRAAGAQAGDDITSSLLRQEVQGRPLRDEEIVSVLRNWTVGEVGTISAALGILVHYLSQHPDLQQQLRAQPSLLPAAIEEILRIHGPLVANRRITTRPVEIGGRTIAAGERLSLIWISANRDGRVFEDPEAYRADRDQAENLLYGAGIHVCPGAPLARMEMRVAMEELLGRTTGIAPIPAKPPTAAVYPGSGFATLNLRIR
ncbi:MAG TPA: cytochrome P450 [Accumulibacter sp.]|uniref:cytochrome P450 n=1 Tax=Accumulibacter sp. TaxID=2053492 RepID=UPI002C929933|nr:cytochrome P450 [Accumulibacter sp.]HRF73216.1 cytochrome P450 [Accumulibacter sp.]